jgi:hypothetical protein
MPSTLQLVLLLEPALLPAVALLLPCHVLLAAAGPVRVGARRRL